MKSLKIRTTVYTDASVNSFPGVYTDIIQGILSNPMVFTNLPIPATTLDDSQPALVSKTNKAKKGSETDKTDRNIQAATCLAILNTLANYVLQIASTKATLEEQIQVVQLSKFTLVKTEYEPTPPIPQVSNVSGKWTGQPNQAVVEWDRIPAGANSYLVYVSLTSPGPETAWELKGVTSHKKFIIDDLPNLGSRVWVQIVAAGKDNEMSVPSIPVEVSIEPVN